MTKMASNVDYKRHFSHLWRHYSVAIITAGWLMLVACGFFVLLKYQSVEGAAAMPSAFWPRGSRLEQSSHKYTLVLMAHPHCPCTRASLDELAVLMTCFHNRIDANVLFIRPAQFKFGWEETDSWHKAAEIPGVRVTTDIDGVEANRFGAQTSGQTLIYDRRGRLIFNGGITAVRGHAGDNASLDAAMAAMDNSQNSPSITSVFGCPLSADGLTTRKSCEIKDRKL